MPPTSVHFNGSVNLSDAETVMREISTHIPAGVRRMTDGETGERGYWIQFQIRKFREMPEFEVVGVGHGHDPSSEAPKPPRLLLRLAEGASVDTISWPDLGYAAAYTGSFDVFDRLQADGTIPADVRFQMQYPTPLASTSSTFRSEDTAAIAASYEKALFTDLDHALAVLPHGRCAVQWDVAVEFGLLEGAMGTGPATPLEQITPDLVRCIDRVPADVPVGLHLCYGDYGHEHFAQPESLRMQVELLNALDAAARRPIDWASFTVPQARADAGYFAPLHDLTVGPETELAFALVPYRPDEQAEGTTAAQVGHIDSALARSSAGSRDWAVCAECGLGRVEVEEVPALLDIHREIITV